MSLLIKNQAKNCILFLLLTHAFPVYANSLEDYCISKQTPMVISESKQLYSSKNKPNLDNSIKLPDLKDKPCSFLASLWGSCEKVPVIYSGNLNRFFMTGHRVTPFGTPWTTGIQIINNKVKSLPEELYGAEYVLDSNKHFYENIDQNLSQLKGVIFRGYASGKALFYDGYAVTSLLDNYLDESITNFKEQKWGLYITSISKRVFLHKSPRYYQKPFLVEIRAGSTVTPVYEPVMVMPIYEPTDIANNGISHIYEFSKDLQLFGIGSETVVAEISGAFQTVIIVPELFRLLQSTKEYKEAMGFSIQNLKTRVNTDYFVVRKFPTTKCLATLNPNKPIVLYDE